MPDSKQSARALIELGAKEYTNGDLDAFKRLVFEDDYTPQEAETGRPRKRQPPKEAALWKKAGAGGFARAFADLQLADLPGDGSTGSPQTREKLTPYQAFFCAWYGLYTKRGGRDFLKKAGLPHSLVECASFLGVSREALYRWQVAGWFKTLGAKAQMDTAFLQMLPDALERLRQNLFDDNGSVANQAIKMVLDANGGPATRIDVRGKDGEPLSAIPVQIVEIIRPGEDG
jgi:hypothetical protein